jgi:hypothetical protein
MFVRVTRRPRGVRIKLYLYQLNAEHDIWYAPTLVFAWPASVASVIAALAWMLLICAAAIAAVLLYVLAVVRSAQALNLDVDRTLKSALWTLVVLMLSACAARELCSARASYRALLDELAAASPPPAAQLAPQSRAR